MLINKNTYNIYLHIKNNFSSICKFNDYLAIDIIVLYATNLYSQCCNYDETDYSEKDVY